MVFATVTREYDGRACLAQANRRGRARSAILVTYVELTSRHATRMMLGNLGFQWYLLAPLRPVAM